MSLLRWLSLLGRLLGEVLTLDQLQKRGHFLANRCFRCISEVEMGGSPSSSLCKDSGSLESTLLPLWCVLDSFLLVKETLLGWHGSFVSKACKKAWQIAHLYIFWTVWKERNMLAFGNKELSLQRLKNYFVCNFCSWVRVSIDLSPSSLVSFH